MAKWVLNCSSCALVVAGLCCKILHTKASQQCSSPEYSIFGMMLARHTFLKLKTNNAGECIRACNSETRCQSFNYVVTKDICELNNRTKEATPEDFVPNEQRYYMKRSWKRVLLGSIPELPAESCQEIKSSEGGNAVSGEYWFDSIVPGSSVRATCDMEVEDMDECNLPVPVCNANATCWNTIGSFICTCKDGFTGDGKQCEPVSTVCGQTCFFNVTSSGRFGEIQQYIVLNTGLFTIRAGGARGGTHSYSYGNLPGTYYGGKGAVVQGTFSLTMGTVLNIVVGQRGGNSVEVRGGEVTNLTAAELGLSVEDNAGTGGGGGSFIYTLDNELLLAAGGGGGGSGGYHGVDGQAGPNGTSSVGEYSDSWRAGGADGQPGQCNNHEDASYHGGVGAGWFAQECPRLTESDGERGGSRLQGWVGGRAGSMNSGFNGGPPPGAVGGFGGGGGGSEDNGASGGGGGYSGGGSGIYDMEAGGGGGSYCGGSNCVSTTGDNDEDDGFVEISSHVA